MNVPNRECMQQRGAKGDASTHRACRIIVRATDSSVCRGGAPAAGAIAWRAIATRRLSDTA